MSICNRALLWVIPVLVLAGQLPGCKGKMEASRTRLTATPGKTVGAQMKHNGRSRDYYVHFPADYEENKQYPLLLALHGGFGKAERVENYTHLSEKADEEGFLVAYPQGYWRSWNAGWCCGPAKRQNIDDVGFLSALIDKLASQYPVDTKRVFVTGLSNGGFMAYRLLCERPEKVTAIAPIAASMVVKSCKPGQPGSIVHFHSYQDEHVPFYGGVGEGPSGAYKPPVDSVLNVWADINGCTVRSDTLQNNGEYDLIEWRSCNQGARIRLYVTHDGGHSWPGSSLNFPDPASGAINANDRMWDFFTDITKTR